MKKSELEIKNRDLIDKNYQLERQIDYLFEELVALSMGLGSKPEWYKEGLTSWDKAMSNKAANAVKKLHEMRK